LSRYERASSNSISKSKLTLSASLCRIIDTVCGLPSCYFDLEMELSFVREVVVEDCAESASSCFLSARFRLACFSKTSLHKERQELKKI
jgi:hypothetical protein